MKKALTHGLSLPSSLLLTTWMGYWSHFFIVATAPLPRKLAAYILWAFVTVIFFQINHTGDFPRYRRIFFVALALLFFPDFIGQLLEGRGSMAISEKAVFSNNVPFCHIAITTVTLPFILTGKVIFPASVRWIYMMLIIWLGATLTIGRGWCSWACFYGGWDDGASRLARKARLKIAPGDNRFRLFSFVILAFSVLASLSALATIYCDWLCPFKAITEFAPIDSLRAYIMTILFILLFFGLVLILPVLTRKRFQCTSFCPMGALQSLLNPISLYRIRIDPSRCQQCMACVNVCPTLSLPPDTIREHKKGPLITCTRCGECISICPTHAIEYAFAFCRSFGWLEKMAMKFEQEKKLSERIVGRVFRSASEIFSARALFTFSAFFFGMIFMSSFGTGTIDRLLHLVIR
jgi:polyferredoxin